MSKRADEVFLSQNGFHGCEYIDDTADHVGPYSRIVATEATVINAMTIGAAVLTDDITVAIDQEYRGHITLVDLTSGAVLAYKVASTT